MDFQSWLDNMSGLVSVYSFDILPDGSCGEVKIMAVNKANARVLAGIPNAPEFYPGIPWTAYYSEMNHIKFCHRCGRENVPLYSYVNAHGFWIKGFYLPIPSPENGQMQTEHDGVKTVYLLYVMTRSDKVDADSMTQNSADVASAVTNISIKLHETQDFIKAMSETVGEIRKVCGSERCSLYTVDTSTHKCMFINEYGEQPQMIDLIAKDMECKPYDVALAWEKDLEGSDCLLLDDLSIIKERDPVWYKSLCRFDLKSIVLYSVRYNQSLVGFIWAANFDKSKILHIKETLALTSFLIGAVIANHHLLSKLEMKSSIDELTQVGNRNAMNERINALLSRKDLLPATMGVVFTDLNGLKAVNDKHGHAAGDKLLTRAASLLKLAFGDHEIFRAGGDEFVVLCPCITKQALENKTAQLRTLAEAAHDVSFAIGTEWVKGEYDINRIMQTADARMYEDKQEYYRCHPDKDRRKS